MKELAIILATGKLGILTVPLTGGSFAGGGWTPEEWRAVRSPRWSHIGGWVQHADHIANEVRAKELTFTSSPEGAQVKTWDVTGKEIVIGISPVE